jgi:uncharacterized protein (TIGR03663 family)
LFDGDPCEVVRVSSLMLVRLLRCLPLAIVAIAGLWLRTYHLSLRPMHSDEANQGVKTGELLEHGRYAFDPHDHHGPTLYYAALPIAWLRGESTLAALSETSLRLVPAIAGTVSILLLAALAAPLGRWTSLAAAAFLALSPPAVYYSRYFIQETLLVTFTLSALVSLFRWWRSGDARWAIGAGLSIGLMQATKASAPLFLLAAVIAFLVVRPGPPASVRRARDFFLGLIAAILIAGLFYSSFGTHWSGLRDALSVYAPAAHRVLGDTGHEKPWWYYLRLFGWHREGGLLWQQLGFSALAVCGLVLALRKHSDEDEKINGLTERQLARWAAAYFGIVALVLSATPYKTPWHAIHLVPGLALLAASALNAFPSWRRATIVTGVVLAMQFSQVKLAAFFRPTDVRNPYAYVHSSPDVVKFRTLVQQALIRDASAVVRVIGEEYWPIPWYLRGMQRVGYWTTPPDDCDGAIVLATGAQADAVRQRLRGSYRETLLGLRPGVLCVVFSRQP